MCQLGWFIGVNKVVEHELVHWVFRKSVTGKHFFGKFGEKLKKGIDEFCEKW